MSDDSGGSAWWQASDGNWYAPELHPDLRRSESAWQPRLDAWDNSTVLPGSGSAPPVTPLDQLRPVLGPDVVFNERPHRFKGRAHQPVRPMAILIGLVVALIVLRLAAPVVGSLAAHVSHHSTTVASADRIAIPSLPPSLLGGQPADPQGLKDNSSWSSLTSSVASQSTTSFGSVYGEYPPQVDPTADTFLVIGAEPMGGTGDTSAMGAQLRAAAQEEKASFPESHSVTTATRPSVFGGLIVCASFILPQLSGGECFWQSPVVSVMVFTYTADLAAVNELTDLVVTELHSETPNS
jgi:hypothetical protein